MIDDLETYWVRIYLAGPINVAKQTIRRLAKDQGLCVTITPTTYIYTGGEEEGYFVEWINYPKYPKETVEIFERALLMAHALKEDTFQDSFMVVSPKRTYWYSDRDSK